MTISWGKKTSVLVTALLVLAWSTISNARAQRKLSDEDMRAIVRILFEHELHQDPNGRESVVLVGPNFNSSWIPTLPGFLFRKLSYAEQKQVPEYYDLRANGVGRAIKSWVLEQGNYCKKVGTLFTFHKHGGKWLAESIGAVESTSSTGTHCVGCRTGSGGVYTVRHSTVARSPSAEAAKGPVLSGRVLNVSCQRIEQPYIECRAGLSLTLTNLANKPLIVLQPIEGYDFWLGGTSLALSRSDADSRTEILSRFAWPSIYKFPIYQKLADLLDQRRPPANVTRIIQPLDRWEWKTTVSWRLEDENNCSDVVGVEIGWNEIKRLSAPLWLRVAFEMWPFNVENFKQHLGRELRKRWQAYGDLYLAEGSSRYSHWSIVSEPIELDLRNVELTNRTR